MIHTQSTVSKDCFTFQHLTDDFRLNFAHFWLSIFQRDENGIKHYANNLGIGNNYRLFACMVTGRSWRSILNGINTAKKNRAESKEIKEKVSKYLKEITKVLATDQMILILKTGDLLRNIHITLGTQERYVKYDIGICLLTSAVCLQFQQKVAFPVVKNVQ